MERKFVKKELIEKGWSKDKKYCVTDDNGQKFLLRISPLEQLEYKKAEFENMKEIYALGIPMCEPLEFGTCEEGVYSLQSWIDGEDAEEMIPTLPDEQAYVYGCEAGKILCQNGIERIRYISSRLSQIKVKRILKEYHRQGVGRTLVHWDSKNWKCFRCYGMNGILARFT